jgi:hypothetical protein
MEKAKKAQFSPFYGIEPNVYLFTIIFHSIKTLLLLLFLPIPLLNNFFQIFLSSVFYFSQKFPFLLNQKILTLTKDSTFCVYKTHHHLQD